MGHSLEEIAAITDAPSAPSRRACSTRARNYASILPALGGGAAKLPEKRMMTSTARRGNAGDLGSLSLVSQRHARRTRAAASRCARCALAHICRDDSRTSSASTRRWRSRRVSSTCRPPRSNVCKRRSTVRARATPVEMRRPLRCPPAAHPSMDAGCGSQPRSPWRRWFSVC